MNVHDMKHPIQPIGFADDGRVRFKPNAIVAFLLDEGGFDLNFFARRHAAGQFSQEDYTQLMQLIGYSTDGYGELSTSPSEIVAMADAAAAELRSSRG